MDPHFKPLEIQEETQNQKNNSLQLHYIRYHILSFNKDETKRTI